MLRCGRCGRPHGHYVDFDARVYDIKTGKRIRLTDIFPEGSEAWSILSAEVRAQLSAAFPALDADEETLAALADKKQLETAPFTMGAARLTLTYRADALYPGKNTLLHVNIDYQKLRQHMTPSAFAQTDNSRFRMAALTYDDGPCATPRAGSWTSCEGTAQARRSL